METTEQQAAPAAADTNEEPVPERSDITKAKRLVFLRHLAHEGMMIDRVNRNLHNAERLQTFAATGDTKDLEAPAEDDPMGVNIGNEYHYHGVQPPTTPPTTVETVTQAAADTAKSVIPKVVMALSLLGGGSGIGYIIHDVLKPPAVAQTGADTDTDTIVEMDFPT